MKVLHLGLQGHRKNWILPRLLIPGERKLVGIDSLGMRTERTERMVMGWLLRKLIEFVALVSSSAPFVARPWSDLGG